MPMEQNGLGKLTEEMGEVGKIVGKLLGYPALQYETDQLHPDGTNLRRELELELGDLTAAIAFVADKLGLNLDTIERQFDKKTALFDQWDQE